MYFILEVNKPLSMSPFNNQLENNWPRSGSYINIPKSEKIQYDFADLISVDSSLRAKWIIDFVGSHYKKKILINHNGVNTKLFKPIVNDLPNKKTNY